MSEHSEIIEQLQKEIQTIKERNRRVESNKAWETSWTRRISIACLTYIVVCIFFIYIGVTDPFTNAIVPVIGFLLSTLSIGIIKSVWIKYYDSHM
jgi:hypothetical protein